MTNDGGPAFPQQMCGMSLMDWFAGQALSGLAWKSGSREGDHEAAQQVAEACYIMADAMLAERAKGGQS
jgi:hypothetical protein